MPNLSSLHPYSSNSKPTEPTSWGEQLWDGVEVNCSENLNQIIHTIYNYEVIKKW